MHVRSVSIKLFQCLNFNQHLTESVPMSSGREGNNAIQVSPARDSSMHMPYAKILEINIEYDSAWL